MNRLVKSKWRRLAPVLGVLAVLLSGCNEERIVWAPDGSRAAVITNDGLHFCDGRGRLTPLLAPQVYTVAWLGDSQGLVAARAREAKDWAAIAQVLGPERAAAVAGEADALLQRLQQGAAWSVLTMDLKGTKSAVKICLRDRHPADLQSRLSAGEWTELAGETEKVSELVVERFQDDKLEPGPILYTGIGSISAIRPSPNDRAVAFTADAGPGNEDLRLLLAPIDASAPPVEVARYVSAFPDWLPDGRTLVYFESSGPGPADDAIRLGDLARRQVLDPAGRLEVAGKPDYLAGVLFSLMGRVRCLRDGRIIFAAAEVELPFAAADYGDSREQLFAVDPTRQPTLTRLIPRKQEEGLPRDLSLFEVSPDERQVVFGSTKGDVCLLTLATGEVEQIQAPAKDSPQGMPVWRAAGEFTYVKRIAGTAGESRVRKVEVVLRRGKQETVLSKDWPDEVVNGLVE